MGKRFAEVCKDLDAVILFPFTGPTSEREWIRAMMKQKLGVIVGGEMTHKHFLESDGGFIRENAPKEIYTIAAEECVVDFVVPGNKVGKCLEYNELIKKKIKNPVYYSPGLIAQGGKISDLAKKLDSWHAIVGRGIYESADMKKAAEEYAGQLQ